MSKEKNPQEKEVKKEKGADTKAFNAIKKRLSETEAKLNLTATLLAEVVSRLKSAKSLKGL